MPELPEVETIRRDLNARLKGKKIARVKVRKAKLVRGSAAAFERQPPGRHVVSINRRGKLLVTKLAPAPLYLLVHLKMTGQLIYVAGGRIVAGGHGEPDGSAARGRPGRHTHVILYFRDGSRLLFNDARQFGYVALANEEEKDAALGRFGVEPTSADFTPGKLGQILRGRRTPLKNVLLDQSKIAGLGSIYADEACHLSGVRPSRPAGSLTPRQIEKLHHGIGQVLTQAIKHRGTTFNSYVDTAGRSGSFLKKLRVYGREGKQCRRAACRRRGAVINKIKINRRGASFCPACQV